MPDRGRGVRRTRVRAVRRPGARAALYDARPRARRSPHCCTTRARDVRCNAGTLWFDFNPVGMVRDASDARLAEGVAEQLLPRLLALRRSMEGVAASDWTEARDPSQRREAACYQVCAAVLVAGIGAWLWSHGTGLPRPLTFHNVETKALGVTLALTALAAGVVWFLLDRSSRLHLVLFEVVLSFAPGLWRRARPRSSTTSAPTRPRPRCTRSGWSTATACGPAAALAATSWSTGGPTTASSGRSRSPAGSIGSSGRANASRWTCAPAGLGIRGCDRCAKASAVATRSYDRQN